MDGYQHKHVVTGGNMWWKVCGRLLVPWGSFVPGCRLCAWHGLPLRLAWSAIANNCLLNIVYVFACPVTVQWWVVFKLITGNCLQFNVYV